MFTFLVTPLSITPYVTHDYDPDITVVSCNLNAPSLIRRSFETEPYTDICHITITVDYLPTLFDDHAGEDPAFAHLSLDAWQHLVQADETRLGYWDWVHQELKRP
jgi:hypothetical protein